MTQRLLVVAVTRCQWPSTELSSIYKVLEIYITSSDDYNYIICYEAFEHFKQQFDCFDPFTRCFTSRLIRFFVYFVSLT